MRERSKLRLALAALAALHALVLGAGFFAPYDPTAQNRALPFAPPTAVRFVDADGQFHWRPFVYRVTDRADGTYEEDRSRILPLRFFVLDAQYRLGGMFTSRWHLFGVDEPGRIFLLGSDAYGRDQLSRLLFGGQISLFAGLLATALSLMVGVALGTVAGFYGKWVDDLLMRLAELFLALPWLYLLFALRAFLPLHIGPAQAFLLLIAVIGLVGWARPARLVRGVVLSAKESKYVLAGRGFGASNFYLLRRHVLPQTAGVVLTQAALLVPHYVLAEVTLSFLGLGVGEPVPTWGNMLAALQQYHVLVSYWWMYIPGLILIPVFLIYSAVASEIHKRVKFTLL